MMVLALLWPRYNAAGASTSMVVGFACVPFFKFAVPYIGVGGATIAKVDERALSAIMPASRRAETCNGLQEKSASAVIAGDCRPDRPCCILTGA